MGEQDRAVHEISDSRARLSELATELSRRVDKEHVKEFATEKATELKERAREFATEKADELKQHAKDVATEKAIEMKDNAREAVMTKTTELKERADTPKGWSLLGAIIGAGVGSALMRKAFSVREDRYESELYGRDTYGRGAYGEDWRYDAYGRRDLGGYGMRGEIDRSDISSPARVGSVSDTTQGLSMSGDVGFEGREIHGADQGSSMKDKVSDVKERAAEMKDTLKDRAHELKERTVGRVREHVPARDELRGRAYEMRGKASHWFDRTLEEQPMLLALGGIAVGMLASSMLPVTRRERRLMEPAKHRVEERISELGDRLTDKLRGESESEGADLSAERASSSSSVGAREDFSHDLSSTDLNASDRNIGPGSMGVSEAHTSAEVDRSADLSSPSGSRIPPLPPLDDMTKVH